MENFKCVIIEDQLPAQRILKRFIKDMPSLALIGCFNNAVESLATLQSQSIDILFLDIHLPQISGLNFLKSFHHPPNVIITTAFPQYALEGFELEATDYLLKPFSFERFIKAVSKIKRNTISTLSPNAEDQSDSLFIKSGSAIQRVELKSIEYVKAEGDFIQIITRNGKHLINNSLSQFAHILPEQRFVRCHKSYVVNWQRIDKILGNTIYMDGTSIPIGRKYRPDLIQKINLIS